jgi:hypothetical protein
VIVLHRCYVSGVAEHGLRRLARSGNHRGDENQEPRWYPRAYDWRDVAAEHLAEDDGILPFTNGVNHALGVRRESGGIVVDGQVHKDHTVPSSAELGVDEVPVPSHVPGAMDQDVRRS